MKTILAMAMAAALVTGATAGATTWYVDTGNEKAADTNAGTAEAPLKTISAAAGKVEPGDTVLIKGGTYRESVYVRRGGEEGKPVTFRAAEGERVIITGADLLSGWRKAAADDLKGLLADGQKAPDLGSVWVTELDWRPTMLYEGLKKMTVARTPDAGWWQPTAAEGKHAFTDATNLVQASADAWKGWTLVLLYQAGGGTTSFTGFTYDPATHSIELGKDWPHTPPIDPNRDRYYFENSVAGLDGPGQWVIVPSANGKGSRVFAWPSRLNAEGRPQIEAPRRNVCVEFQKVPWLVFDGLEVRFSTNHGFDTGNAGPHHDVVIQNCVIHHNAGYGIGLRSPERVTIRRNMIRWNSNGIVLNGSKDSVIEENDIGWNNGDGLDAPNGTRNLKLVRNYIHDHYLWGHPDNIQFWTDCQGIEIRDNVLWNGGQSMMSADMKDTKLINNIWCGTHAVSMIAGGDGWDIRSNTVCATGLQPTNFGGKNFTLTANVIAPLRGLPLYSVQDPATFKADYNLLSPGPGYKGALAPIQKDWTATSLEGLQKKGLEEHGIVAEAQFVNAPKFYITTFYQRVAEMTTTKFYTWGKFGDGIKVGDHVELAFDGVPRKVTEAGEDWFVVDTPLAAPPVTTMSVANWGEKTDLKWDLRLKEGSPGTGAGPDGKDVGAKLDLRGYMQGDFNGDGKRDVPAMPED